MRRLGIRPTIAPYSWRKQGYKGSFVKTKELVSRLQFSPEINIIKLCICSSILRQQKNCKFKISSEMLKNSFYNSIRLLNVFCFLKKVAGDLVLLKLEQN